MNHTLPITLTDGVKMDPKKARAVGEQLSADYCFAEPFPHIVIDNFLPQEVIHLARDHFPKEKLQSDVVFDSGYAGLHKRQILPEDCDGEARALFNFFNSQPMVEFLEGLTTIDGLIGDPYFTGGGYHETSRGGLLGIHADFRINEKLHVHRRLNVIIYLNEEWDESYGGALELWDRKMTHKVKAVQPVFNRCVIFNTDADSFHGHPDPLTCPEHMKRRSMALYYYTASKSIHLEVPANSTRYAARPDDSPEVRREARRLWMHEQLKQWVPPALLRYGYAIKRRIGG
jgi:hypothetical protein